jgi:flavin reductase (DIM6/NTAB) family NADH-FMN oxidoreductase RutF
MWPGQYELFSHFEFASGIPQVLFLITTRKENGLPNACFHSWSAFSGDSGGFFAVLGGLGMNGHTYQNILRDKEFCVNFISSAYYDACMKTIEHNEEDDDEFVVGGFALEQSKTINAPRIKEAFLSFECTLHSTTDLSGKGIIALVVGQVNLAAVEEGYHTIDKICSADGYMLNVHSPKDPRTGEGNTTAVATLRSVRLINE